MYPQLGQIQYPPPFPSGTQAISKSHLGHFLSVLSGLTDNPSTQAFSQSMSSGLIFFLVPRWFQRTIPFVTTPKAKALGLLRIQTDAR